MRLLKSSNFKNNNENSLLEFVEEALAFRRSVTITLMKSLQEAICSHQARSESLALAFNGEKSNEGRKKKKSCTFSLFITLHLNSILISHYTFD